VLYAAMCMRVVIFYRFRAILAGIKPQFFLPNRVPGSTQRVERERVFHFVFVGI
jgi:hypothetical protein